MSSKQKKKMTQEYAEHKRIITEAYGRGVLASSVIWGLVVAVLIVQITRLSNLL